MTPQRTYITTTIPYVNARPHLGFALELVQADVLARRARQRGEHVRALTGTDDNSLKNVLAAKAEATPVQDFVDRNAATFAALREPLGLSFDDFIRTSSDPRHRSGVEKLWRLCAERGDLYRKHYEGLYCVGCEQFYAPEDLADGRCPDHGTEPQIVSEENWFFRLSRYASQLRELIADGRLRIEPASRRNEILSLIDGGLHDFSVSRSQARAHGWGIPVPGDPSQVIYVWWDALGNYVTSLGFGTGDPEFAIWWERSERRIHLAGKGVIRFHAVYWPAMLLSAGLPLPTEILVHDYLTIDGHKISKSSGATADPAQLVEQVGTDAVRWWLLREVPRVGDADFTLERLVERANSELAGGVGNLVHRTITMIHRYRGGAAPVGRPSGLEDLRQACELAPGAIDAALDDFDFRQATSAVWRIVDEANRAIDATRPWQLAKEKKDSELDAALAALYAACLGLATCLAPFLPSAAELITAQCAPGDDGVLPKSTALFPRIETS
jgi:methionyl-tRNA synthetase